MLHVVHACGHTSDIKVAPNISAVFMREIRVEAKRAPCQACSRAAGKRAAKAK